MKTQKINSVLSPTLTGPKNCFPKRFLKLAKASLAVPQFKGPPFCILQFAFCIKSPHPCPSCHPWSRPSPPHHRHSTFRPFCRFVSGCLKLVSEFSLATEPLTNLRPLEPFEMLKPENLKLETAGCLSFSGD